MSLFPSPGTLLSPSLPNVSGLIHPASEDAAAQSHPELDSFLRCTVRDNEKTVSFCVDERTLRSLIAACAAAPPTLEAMLRGAEALSSGISARVMHELLDFDQRQRWVAVHPDEPTALPPFTAFEVVDHATEHRAETPLSGGLVYIDLVAATISGAVGAHDLLVGQGRITHPDPITGVIRETVYSLSDSWTIVSQAHALAPADAGMTA